MDGMSLAYESGAPYFLSEFHCEASDGRHKYCRRSEFQDPL